MVTKKELADLRLVSKGLFEIDVKGNTTPSTAKIMEKGGLIKPLYKLKKKKGFQQGDNKIKVFDKYILTDKGKKSLRLLSAIL